MSDEIISKLMRNHKKLEFLAEDLNPLYEADDDEDEEEAETAPGADEDYAALTDEDAPESDPDELDREDTEEDLSDEEIDDDSTAPEQGSPDDPDPEPEDLDIPEPSGSHSSSHGGGGSASDSAEGEEAPEENAEDAETEVVDGHQNPLENQYAIKFTMGDDIKLMSAGADSDELRSGVIDGYDTEGFYRVKWSDGTTTNGLTDIALAGLVRAPKVQESVCICGSTHIIKENDQMICDDCGRLYEGALDALTLADKSRPKGKRMIRSEAHPVSTAIKPNIAEAIRKAFSGKSLNEEDDPEIEEDAFDNLKKLDGEFWTRQEEMKEDIESLGYTVEELNDEYVVVSSDKDDDYVYQIYIEGTSRSFTLNFSKSRKL